MLALALATLLSAGPSPRLVYEQKCLYCHSEDVIEGKQVTPRQWVKLIETMRLRAPLLITKSDAAVVLRYVTQTLKLVPARKVTPAPVPVSPPTPVVVVTPVPKGALPPTSSPLPLPPPLPQPELDPDFDLPDAGAVAEADRTLEQQGFALMERRCSRCHTLGRVYGKLDSLERALAVIERMRVKTGSGITAKDQALLEDFVRAQLER
jgi:cytochrome c5